MLINVLQGDALGDHHDLEMVQQLAHLFGRTVRALVFGRNPGLPRLFDDLLADEVRALASSSTVREPSGLVTAFSDSSANSDSNVFMICVP